MELELLLPVLVVAVLFSLAVLLYSVQKTLGILSIGQIKGVCCNRTPSAPENIDGELHWAGSPVQGALETLAI